MDVGEVLSEEESAALQHDQRPDSEVPIGHAFSEEESAALERTGKVEDPEIQIGQTLSEDETNHLQAMAIMNGTYGKTEVPLGETMGQGNTWGAAQHFYKNHDSTFRKILYSLNLPEQFLMRQGVAAMSGMGVIDEGSTKALLGNDELSPSDIIDYYWKPSSVYGRAGRLATGLVADVLFDPLNLIGVGEVKSALNIAGKTVTGLEKMSEAQRAVFKTMGAMEHVVASDGAILHADDALKATSTLEQNMKLLADARDAAQQGNPLGFMGLEQAMNLSAEGKEAMQKVLVEGLTKKSAAAQLAAGDRELTIGLRLPFTNIAIEGKIPGPISETIGKGLQAMGTPTMVGATAGGLMAGPVGAMVGGAGGMLAHQAGPAALEAMNTMAETMNGLRNMPLEDLEKQSMKLRAISALDNTFNLGGAYAGAMGMSQEVYRKWQNLWTKTSDVLFNRGMEQSVNLKGKTAEQLAQQTKQWGKGLENVKARIGDTEFKGLMEDFLNEAERGIYSPEEAHDLAKKFNQSVFDKHVPIEVDHAGAELHAAAPTLVENRRHELYGNIERARDAKNANAERAAQQKLAEFEKKHPEGPLDFNALNYAYTPLKENPLVTKLYKASPEDLARMERISKHPELTDMLGTMRDQLKTMVGKYDERNLPFDELNPFGEGWMNRYVKHSMTAQWKDYMSKTTAAQDAWVESMRGAEGLVGKFDESSLGRKYRGGILEANEASMEKTGIKMFVDDPVQLFNMRIQEMQDVVAKHDLLRSAFPGAVKNYNPGTGWIKADPNDFGHMETMYEAQKARHDALLQKETEKVLSGGDPLERGKLMLKSPSDMMVAAPDPADFKSLSFLPEEMRQAFRNGDSVYFRNDVYDRMLWNTQRTGSSSGLANTLAAVDAYTWFWRNGVLASTGYLGTKFFHNMLSYFGLMGHSNPEYLYKATAALAHPQSGEYVSKLPGMFKDGVDVLSDATRPNSGLLPKSLVNWKQPEEIINGERVQRSIGLSHEQFLDLAKQHGVLGTGTEVLLDDVLDHTAAAFGRAPKAKDLVSKIYMFGVYRNLAQWGDDIPKLAAFAQRLENGFTAEAAAEHAVQYFHNFNPVTAEQQIAKAVVPFISFPMKTAELMAHQVVAGKWGELAIPGHVQKVLEGAWVDDRDLRNYLSKTLPETKNWYEPLHGGLTPGARSMSIELPWCYNTLSLMWNEDSRLHPVFQLLTAAMAVRHDGSELDEITDVPTAKRVIGQNLDLAMPQYARNALTLYAINGGKFPGSDYLIEKYQTSAPDISQYMDLQTGKHILTPLMTGKITDDNPTGGPTTAQIQQSAMNTKFQNAVDFGKWANTYLDSNWLYNLMFHGSIKAGEEVGGEFADNQAAIRGEWIRRHIHDATLGLVAFDKNDQTFFSKYAAIDREIKMVKRDMFQDANKTFQLTDPKKMGSREALEAAEKDGLPQAKRIMKLMDERDALVSFQDWYLMSRKTVPDFSLHRLLFGVDQLQMSEDGKPGPQMTEALHPKDRNISDDDASRFFNNAVAKKWYGQK